MFDVYSYILLSGDQKNRRYELLFFLAVFDDPYFTVFFGSTVDYYETGIFAEPNVHIMGWIIINKHSVLLASENIPLFDFVWPIVCIGAGIIN